MSKPTVHDTDPHYGEPDAERGGAAPAPMVERAFRLLDLLATSEAGYSLSELARLLEMSKGSLHGLLKTLESGGVVEQDSERRYALGPRLYNLTQAYIRRSGLRRFALPAMRRLAALSGQTVFLGQIEPDGVRISERVDEPGGRAALRVSARRGDRVSLLAGAIGRAVLASWPRARREDYLRARTLPHFTARSITDPDAYLAAVEETARTGVGVDREEYLTGVNAVAAPIHGFDHQLLALVWIVGFSAYFDDAALTRAAGALREETQAISKALGAE
ncbi:MAG TPA: IclR family transcriptional regulator [Ktedonobacterales bacterium]